MSASHNIEILYEVRNPLTRSFYNTNSAKTKCDHISKFCYDFGCFLNVACLHVCCCYANLNWNYFLVSKFDIPPCSRKVCPQKGFKWTTDFSTSNASRMSQKHKHQYISLVLSLNLKSHSLVVHLRKLCTIYALNKSSCCGGMKEDTDQNWLAVHTSPEGVYWIQKNIIRWEVLCSGFDEVLKMQSRSVALQCWKSSADRSILAWLWRSRDKENILY